MEEEVRNIPGDERRLPPEKIAAIGRRRGSDDAYASPEKRERRAQSAPQSRLTRKAYAFQPTPIKGKNRRFIAIYRCIGDFWIHILWLELDYYSQQFITESAVDVVQLQKMVEEDRIFAFLARLNPELD
uniref:Uncharacterized protein n=1 Tax=Vitis vinifera TaxID=29760 RepID=A5AYG4_VITVI|nr:hypothetical protein VITISV_027060 [Vitis vinifera]